MNLAEDKLMTVSKLVRNINQNFIELGNVLDDIKKTKIYRIKGYETFKEYVESEYALTNGTCNKVINIYRTFNQRLDMADEDCLSIGYDKLNVIEPLCRKCEYAVAEKWVNEAQNKSLGELKYDVSAYKKANKEKTYKDVIITQHKERVKEYFGATASYAIALIFSDKNMDDVAKEYNIKARKIEEEIANQ